MKKISIIIPCHNSSEWLENCWNSLKNQSIGISELECIFVDDASEDEGKTWSLLERIEKEYPESVIIIRLDENMRQGGARNIGMKYMSGKYMLFLDSDDMYRIETCKDLFELAEKTNADIIRFEHEIVSEVSGGCEYSEANFEPVIEEFDLSGSDDLRSVFLTDKAGPYGCTNHFYRTDLIRRANSQFAEKKVYEEPLFVYPLFLYINKIIFTSSKYYIWIKRSGSTMTSEIGYRLLDHPKVQLELLEDLKDREDEYLKYREEISFHFYFSYYYETLRFSAININAQLPLEYFRTMQKKIKIEVGNIKDNCFYLTIKDKSIHEKVIETIDIKFNTTDELMAHIKKIFS